MPHIDARKQVRAVVMDDGTIGMFCGGQYVGPYDEAALDLAENLERLRTRPSWKQRLKSAFRAFLFLRQPEPTMKDGNSKTRKFPWAITK